MDPALPLLRLPEALSDGVILLDAHTVEDAEAHLEGEDEEMRRRFDAPRPATLADTRAAMARWIEGRAAGGPMFAYALRQPSGRLIGGSEFRMLTPTSANVSYWVFPSFRQQGFGARALALLCEAAAHVENLERIEAHIAPDNLTSRRVAERAGFIEVGSVQETSSTGATTTMTLQVRSIARRAGT
ncbi:MAG TPA: GNAT family N-acetyltransferase [Caulobacteraceae bacterium]|nr:GNAT family N-acetyltransferase [Caulobacteraceae bacterium]